MNDEGRPGRNGPRHHQPPETLAGGAAVFRGSIPRLEASCDIQGAAVVRLVADSAESEDALRAHLDELTAAIAAEALRITA
jgi:hypothetical protein